MHTADYTLSKRKPRKTYIETKRVTVQIAGNV